MGDRSPLWMVLSLTLHGAGMLLVVPRPATPRAPEGEPIAFELTVRAESTPVAAVVPAPPPPSTSSRPPAAQSARPIRAVRGAHAPTQTSASTASTAESGASAAPKGAPAAVPKGVPSPLAAAYTIAAARDDAPPPDPAKKLNEAIARGAARKVDVMPDPVLQRGPKGGYVYSGHGFDAIIAPDGSVTMNDRYGKILIPFKPYQLPNGEWRVALIGGSFKLFEWLDRKLGKNDPFRSERRWFLDRTRALRERLSQQHAPDPRTP